MRTAKLFVVAGVAALLVLNLTSSARNHTDKPDKPRGLGQRVPWTTSKIKGSPEPPTPYRVEVAFPKLKFFEPLELTAAPGTSRLFVAQRDGKLFSFVPDPKTEKAELLLDLKKVVYGLAFHPNFDKNGYFYVTYIRDPSKEEARGTRVSRFQARGNPPRADLSSEKIILEWPSGGHNGGCLRFGPDGLLYIATGDGSGIADQLETGQDLSDLLGSILRIDVNRAEGGRLYAIPKDNPFVDHKGARPEIYAYGLRQPWKFSFDRKTNDLWAGEVGQDIWEMVYRIEKGGNYGWSVTEGGHPFRPQRKKGPTPLLKPIVEHHHTAFRSITGGYVYHGSRLKELTGAYIYGDFDTGRVWSFRYQAGKVSAHRELAKTALRIVAFGEDAQGEIYLVDWMGGQLHRLVKAPPETAKSTFPRKLSETGLFTSTRDLKPAPGLIPYTVNAQLYSDGAIKERYLAIPGDGKIEFDAISYPQPAPGAPRGWRFPDGTVAVKTFFLELEKGNPASRRRLETRILHYQKLAGTEEVGDQSWHGYTYVWNDEQTDAELLDAGGLDRTYTIKDASVSGGQRKQTWHFPSRAECTLCHTLPAKFVLGLNTLQLNGDHDYGGVVVNQLKAWQEWGLFTRPLPAAPEKLPRLADYENEKADLNARARAYLQANCAHCHMKWGGGNAEFQLLATLPLKELGIVNVRPAHGDFGLKDARLVKPGKPEESILYHRMRLTGLGRMPHIASSVVDEKGTRLVRDWIAQMKP